MIVCPNCSHQNPDGAVQCEACYTPLPMMTACPNCGTPVQTDASFCGQCGFNLQAATPSGGAVPPATLSPDLTPEFNLDPDLNSPEHSPDLPDLTPLEPLVPPDPLVVNLPPPIPLPPPPAAAPVAPPPPVPVPPPPPPANLRSTQLQTQVARLLHVQTDTVVELPPNLLLLHIGKPNDRVPPDIDVSGYPNSEIVSRIHADIRVEGDAYYIEDVGSSNGTYINNSPLPAGNRHRLRAGDRIALGKGDKVTFLFQIT